MFWSSVWLLLCSQTECLTWSVLCIFGSCSLWRAVEWWGVAEAGEREGSLLSTIFYSSIRIVHFSCCFCYNFLGETVKEGPSGFPSPFMMPEFFSLWNKVSGIHILSFSIHVYWPTVSGHFPDFYDSKEILEETMKRRFRAAAWCFFIIFLNININVPKCFIILRQSVHSFFICIWTGLREQICTYI